MSEAEQLQDIRNAIYAMVNALGAALPRTPDVVNTLEKLVASDIASRLTT